MLYSGAPAQFVALSFSLLASPAALLWHVYCGILGQSPVEGAAVGVGSVQQWSLLPSALQMDLEPSEIIAGMKPL